MTLDTVAHAGAPHAAPAGDGLAAAVLAALPDAVVVTTVEGEVLLANAAARRLLGPGLEPGAGLGRHLPAAVLDLLPSWWAAAVAGQELAAWTGEAAVVGRADAVVRVTPTSVVLATRLGIVLTCREITESFRAAAQLAASEARLAAVVDGVDTGIALVDPDGRIGLANGALAELTGAADTEELLGARLADLLSRPRADGQGLVADFDEQPLRRRLEEGAASVRAEVEVGTGDRPRWLRVGATLLERFGTDRTDMVVSLSDVSREHELLDALEQSAQRFRLLAEHAPVGIFTTDLGGRCTYANPTWLGLVGLDLDEACATEPLSVVHPDDHERVLEAWERLHPARPSVTVELRALARDGRVRYVRCDLSALPGGEVLGTVVDLSERRQLEERLAREASHDHLTGLPNRAHLDRLLDAAVEAAPDTGAWPTVLFVDLDHFKQVNDGHGHAAGDAVLREVARRLRAVVRDDDVVARYGGDEFVVVSTAADPAVARGVAHRLVAAVARPYRLVGRIDARIGASVGVATARPGESARQALRRADDAAYAAKSAGRGHAVVAEA